MCWGVGFFSSKVILFFVFIAFFLRATASFNVFGSDVRAGFSFRCRNAVGVVLAWVGLVW